MADLLIHEHKKNDAGSYDNVYRKTKAKMVETEDGGTAEQKLSDAANHIANRENPHGATAEQVGADPSGSASQALQDAKNYTDQKIDEIQIPDVSGQIEEHNTNIDAHKNMGWATREYADSAAYEKAKEQGYTGTEAEFYAALVTLKNAPFLPLSGGTLTGNLTGQYLTGTWLQGTADNHLSGAATKICVQDQDGWVYHRTAAEILNDIGVPAAIQSAIGDAMAASY